MKGLELSRQFFLEAVKPITEAWVAPEKYAAGLMGYGSDVLGFDTEISQDHNWGPRCIIFLCEDADKKDQLYAAYENNLPLRLNGFSTSFTDKRSDSTQSMVFNEEKCTNPLIDIYTVKDFIKHTIGYDGEQEPTAFEWLKFQGQKLLELTAGEVYHDGFHELERMRDMFSYYPEDVRLVKMILLWKIIGEEKAFPGRCLHNDDFLGAKLIAARMINRLIKICFYLEKTYIPYSKWTTVAFKKLRYGGELYPLFSQVVNAKDGEGLVLNLSKAYQAVISYQNQLKICEMANTDLSYYYGRPYLVPDIESVVGALEKSVSDKSLLELNYFD